MKKIKLMALLFVSMLSINLWGTDLTPSFSFTSCPSGWPSGSGVTAGTTKTYTVSSTSYTFTLGANVYYNTSKYLMLKSTTYLGLPAVNGYKLTGVSITNSSGCSKSTKVAITTASDGKTNVTGGSAQTFSTTSKMYSYTLSNTTANTSYYLYITSANCQIVTIALTYTAATPSGPTLESIYFTDDAATKLSYTEGDVFDPTGLVVMGNYSEGDDKDVTDDVEWSFSPTTLATTTTSVTVTAHIDDVDDAQKVVNGLTVAAAPKYTKVTANKTDWSGEYLLVYENDGTASVWTGIDAVNSYATATITSNQIAKPAKAVTLTIAAVTDGYSIQVNGGDNDGKYIGKDASGNGMDIGASAYKNTISFSNSSAVIAGAGNSTMRYNTASDQKRFRYYGSGQQAVQLYEKVLDPISSAVNFAAPADGSLVIKSGATPIATGATIQDGTILDVTFGMNTPEAYKDVAIKVTKTDGGDDVTSTVYDATKKQITMPRYAITVAVTFTKLYKIEAATVTGGSFSWEDENKAKPTYVEAGTYIQALQEEATHYEFKSFDIYKTGDATSKVEDANGLFEMPAYDVTISGTFEEMQCTALPSAPVLVTPTISYAEGVTLNWTKLDAASGYIVNVWKGTDKIVVDEMITDVNTLSYKITAELGINTEYSYSIAGIGDDETYCMIGNPANESTFTTADYPAATLTLSENGDTRDVTGLKVNTPFNLPDCEVFCDKVFVGWSTSNAEPSNLMAAGSSYTMTTTAVTLYAWFATETPGTTTWNKVPTNYTDWKDNEFLIVYETSATAGNVMKQADANDNFVSSVVISNGVISAKPKDAMSVVVEQYGTTDNYQLKVAGATPVVYVRGATGNGLSFGDAAETTISYNNTNGWLISNNSSWLRFNTTSGSQRFRFYKSSTYTQSSYKTVQFYKKTAGESTYSNYSTTCEAAIVPPTFSLTEESYTEAKTLELTAPEGAIYFKFSTDAEYSLYNSEEKIKLENRGTFEISAYAKVDDRTSETVTKTYTLNWPYTLDELAASDVADGTTVQVTFENKEITNFYTNSQGKRYGIYVNVQKGGKDVEIYCNKAEHSDSWEVGGKVSSTQAISGTWTYYSGGQQWEFCPNNWDNISYTAPAKITSLVITNDVTNKNYTAGQKLDFTGLTVTGVYSDNTDQNAHTEDVTDEISWTEVTLSENQVEAIAKATLNSVKTGNQDVKATKLITGLTVGAAKTLESIYVADDSEHKKTFFVGRPFSAEGLKVMAHYNMDEDQPIAVANLDITNTTFSEAEAEHAINISYTENGVEKTTSYNVAVKYMNLSELVAEDVPTNTSVKVAFSNVEITGFYKNSSDKRAGVYVNVIGKNGSNIELYSSGTPSATLNDWQEGGKIASKGTYISGTWKYYETNDVWEIDFGSSYAWSTNIEYTAPSIYPTGIAMSIPSATVKQSKSLDLEANFTPANATVLNNLEWSSDNNQVTVVPSQDKKSAKVTVAPDATVGTATITVKVDDKDGNKLSATCVITIQEYSVPHYGLYSGAIEGGDYIFKANGQNYYMNNTNNNGRLANVANENNPEIVNNIITTDAEAYVWQIAKSGDYWTIKNLATQTYVVSTGSGNASLSDSPSNNTEKWSITYDETNEVYTFANLGRSESTSEPTKCYLRNNNNNGWACYGSSTGNAITLYKAGFTPAAALTSIEIDATSDVLTKEYIQGATFSTIGLKVLGNYSDLTQSEITSGITWTVEPSVLNETGDNISVTVTAHAKGFDSESRVITGIKVSEPAQEHVYGFFNFMDNGPDITDWEETSAWSTTYTTHDVVADEATVHFEGAAKQTSTITNMPVVKQAAIVLELTEEDKQITSVILATAKWSSKSKKITAAVSLDGENYTDLEVEGNETDGLSTAITQNGVRYVKFIPESNDNQLGIATLTFTTADIQYDYERTDLVIGNYGTVCVPYEVKATDRFGATFWSIETSNAPGYTNPTSITIALEEGDLEAGKPYIFCAEATTMSLFFSGEAYDGGEDYPSNNGLYGNLTDETIIINDQNDPNAGPEPTRGFFFVLQQKLYECGWNCTVAPNRGWVQAAAIEDMTTPSPAPRRVIGNPNGTPTGINNLNVDGWVDLQGAHKYLYNNHIMIVNEGRIYNAQGIRIQ